MTAPRTASRKFNNLTADDVLTWRQVQAKRLVQGWKEFSGEDLQEEAEDTLHLIDQFLAEHFCYVNVPSQAEDAFAEMGNEHEEDDLGDLDEDDDDEVEDDSDLDDDDDDDDSDLDEDDDDDMDLDDEEE